MFLKSGQSFFYSPRPLTVQTSNIFYRKLPGTYIAQAVIPLGYVPPFIGERGNPPTRTMSMLGRCPHPPGKKCALIVPALPGVNWGVELSLPFKPYFYYTKPVIFTLK